MKLFQTNFKWLVGMIAGALTAIAGGIWFDSAKTDFGANASEWVIGIGIALAVGSLAGLIFSSGKGDGLA